MSERTPVLRAAGAILVVIGLVLVGIAWALGPSAATTNPAGGTTTTLSADGTTATTGDTTQTTAQPGSTDGTGTSTTTSDTTTPGATPTTNGAGATSTTLDESGAPTTASTTANTDLSGELAEAARGAGFTVLGSGSSGWRLASVDSGTTGQGPYVATSYIRGTEYFSTSQEKGTQYPPMANTEPVTVRGQKGDMLDLGHVVVIRWIDNGTSIIFSSNLKRVDALTMANSLAPIL